MDLSPTNIKCGIGLLCFPARQILTVGALSICHTRGQSDCAGAERKSRAASVWRRSGREPCAATGSTVLGIGNKRSIRTSAERRHRRTSVNGQIAADLVISQSGSRNAAGFTGGLFGALPPALRSVVLVEKKLKKIGLSDAEISAFSHNSAIPLSLQVTPVHNLETLGHIPGRRAAAMALGNVITEYQAGFLVTSLGMLSAWSQQNSPITSIKVRGVLLARDQNGTAIMPALVDYVSWTRRIAGFATDPQLFALNNRVLWTTGKMTPLARQQLVANGWTLREASQL